MRYAKFLKWGFWRGRNKVTPQVLDDTLKFNPLIRLIILNSPNNPSAVMYTRGELSGQMATNAALRDPALGKYMDNMVAYFRVARAITFPKAHFIFLLNSLLT